jgi:hypothetical protein
MNLLQEVSSKSKLNEDPKDKSSKNETHDAENAGLSCVSLDLNGSLVLIMEEVALRSHDDRTIRSRKRKAPTIHFFAVVYYGSSRIKNENGLIN